MRAGQAAEQPEGHGGQLVVGVGQHLDQADARAQQRADDDAREQQHQHRVAVPHGGAHANDLPSLIGPVALGTVVLLLLRWRMDVMSLPEDEARSLGARTTGLRLLIVAAATLAAVTSVAAAGIVGWVGLVVPHLARFLVGPSFVRLLPTSAVLGGGLLLLIDTLARTLAPVEIPLGILTALIGSPFFIVLLRRASRGWT